VRRLGVLAVLVVFALRASAAACDFPNGFLWSPAISGFQTDAGGGPANADTFVPPSRAFGLAAGLITGRRPQGANAERAQ
jgi:hypothetical protein